MDRHIHTNKHAYQLPGQSNLKKPSMHCQLMHTWFNNDVNPVKFHISNMYRCDDAYNITMVTRKLVFHNVHMLYANISTIQQLLHMYNACCSYIAITVGRLTFSNTFAVKLHKSKVIWTKDIPCIVICNYTIV